MLKNTSMFQPVTYVLIEKLLNNSIGARSLGDSKFYEKSDPNLESVILKRYSNFFILLHSGFVSGNPVTIWSDVPVLRTGIAWESDKQYKFKWVNQLNVCTRGIRQGCGSALISSGSGSSILGWTPIRIRIQSGSRALMTKNLQKNYSWKFF